jgi:hypothetical protein
MERGSDIAQNKIERVTKYAGCELTMAKLKRSNTDLLP